VLVSSAVRELCLGKGLQFEDKGLVEVKGFDEPVHLYEALWT
jgi:class 3 adenylate cyclase